MCAILGVLIGAMVTSSGGTEFVDLHLITASVMAVVIAALGIWMLAAGVARGLGWTLLILVIAGGGLGHLSSSSAGVAILHALIAQVLLAMTAAASTATSAEWSQPPDRVEDHGWPSLGSLGKIVPVLVLIQIMLGAAFRHKSMGVLSHLFFAMVLILVILCICIFVMQQFPQHMTLKPAAHALMGIAFTQIFLGIGAFTVRSMTTKVTPTVIGVTAVHACVGALTLASAVVLSMHIRRNVYRKQEESD